MTDPIDYARYDRIRSIARGMSAHRLGEAHEVGVFRTLNVGRNPGLLLPAFDEVRVQINQALSEDRVALEIERFLDEAKRRSEIVVLSEV